MEITKVEGLTNVQSALDPTETMQRLEAELESHGMTIFARINHAALAAEAGMSLAPTEVVVFGNPRGGTPLMQASQTIGIDLPLKVLVWQDESGTTWLSYNEPAWLARRHGVRGQDRAVGAMGTGLAKIVAAAASDA
jgi:uncharacterized protein (DUF302 family)